MDSLLSQVKVETLYYFYSAIFQGFAAMFTLVLMLTIYYFQRNDKRRYYLEQRLEDRADYIYEYRKKTSENMRVGRIGIANYVKEKIKQWKVDEDSELVNLWNNNNRLIEDERFVKQILGLMLVLSFLILIASIALLHTCDIIVQDKALLKWSSILTFIAIILYFILSFILMYKIIGYRFIGKMINLFRKHSQKKKKLQTTK